MRNRIAYQNVGLLVGPTPAYSLHTGSHTSTPNHQYVPSKLKQINLVQSASFNFNVARTEIQQIGGHSLTTRKAVVQPDVSIGFTYLLSDGRNEGMLGFCPSGESSAFLSGQQNTSGDRNLFLIVSEKQEQDFNLVNNFSNQSVFGFGNCVPTNYSIQASVGSIPTASVEYLASNVKFDTTSGTMSFQDAHGTVCTIGSGLIPAVNPADGQPATNPYGYVLRTGDFAQSPGTNFHTMGHQNSGDIHYLRPGDVQMAFKETTVGGINLSGSNKMHITDVSIDVPINRTELFGFGSRYAYDRRAKFPSLGNISFTATANNIEDGNVNDIFSEDNDYDFTLTFMDPTSDLGSDRKPSNKAIEIEITKARLQNQNFGQSIGSNMEVSATFTFECNPITGFKFSGIAKGDI
tara:strand:+ start:1397 stop:2614 length:1218 start_codon:yes stop_codon:yes gene_type:complete